MIHDFLQQALRLCTAQLTPLWNAETGIFLSGVQGMAEATEDTAFSQVIRESMDRMVSPEGSIRMLNPDEQDPGAFHIGRLLYVVPWSGESRARAAIETLMEQLRNIPRTESSIFRSPDPACPVQLSDLYLTLPFYIEYENRFNGKANYNDIYSQMTQVRKLLFDPEKHLYRSAMDRAGQSRPCSGAVPRYSLRPMGFHLMTLIDLFDLSSEEVFEQHMQYAIWLKEALRGILPRMDSACNLFPSFLAQQDSAGNSFDIPGSAMVAYAVLKGCRLGALLSEKYRETGEQILRAVIQTQTAQSGAPCPDPGRDETCEQGTIMLACSEYLKLRQQDIV